MKNYYDSDIQRLLKVLEGKIPDRIPYCDFLFSKEIIEDVLERKVGYEVIYRSDRSTKIIVDAKDFIDFYYAIGQDLAGFLILSPDSYYFDGIGEIFKADGKIKNHDIFKKIIYPDFNKYIEEYKKRFLELNILAKDKNMGVTILTGAIFQDTHQLIGFDDFMMGLYSDTSFIKEVLKFFTDIYYEISKFICSLNVPLFFFTDNIAYNDGPFFKPDFFKDLYMPLFKKIIQPAKDKDLPIIFDSDGDIEWLIEDFIDLGISAIHPIDPGGMDIYKIKEKYGDRITIMGNVGQDFPLALGSIDDVANDVKRRIRVLGEGGRYVLKSSHDVGDNVKVKNFEAMIETLHEFGYYK
ncbi:MAG: hypothetical protein M1409_03410 [Actinobacteria bacterium]|nr:hypothetical protein [Actinomycetota bacterium]